MQMEDLQLKRALRSVLLFLLLSVAGMGKGYADSYYEVTMWDVRYGLYNYDGFQWAEVLGHENGTSATGELIILENVTYEGVSYSVTEIGWHAFAGCSGLTGSLIIPNSVTRIGDGAFAGCTGFSGSLTIPNSVTTIDSEAFLGCSGFTGSLTIPGSVTTIEVAAFRGCSGFTGSLTIPNSVTTIKYEAFRDCAGFTGTLAIPNSVTIIDDSAFAECYGITGLTIGNSVAVIEDFAFCNCIGLTSFNIPNSVRKIGQAVFRGTGWYTQQSNGILYKDNWCLGWKGEPTTATGSLMLNEDIIGIADYAFYNFSGFTGSLIIPNSVTTIGECAFTACSGFTGSLTIGNSVTMIDQVAFWGCTGFISITSLAETPPTLCFYNYSLDNSPFKNWSNSTPVYVPCGFEEAYASYTSMSWGGFDNFYGLCGGTVAVSAAPEEGGTVAGGGSFEAGEACTVTATANEGYFFAEWTQDGKRVSTNAEYTFYVASDTKLVAHFIADDVIDFADDDVKAICVSHWDTDGDGELNYSEAASVTSLGNYFKNNSAITSFNELQYFIGLSSIGDNAFSGCSGLTSIILPNSIKWIGSSAFNGCSGLTGSLTIPNSVTQIGYRAFYDCCSIDEIIMLSTTPPTLGTDVFCTTNPNFTIYVPYESLNAYKTANNWNYYEPYIKPMFSPSVAGYVSSTSNDNWTFIALPLVEDTDPAAVLNLLSEDHVYDLYQYDQSAEGEEWRNYKVDSFNLVNGRGYLYATAVDLNLIIGGEFNEDDTKEVSLDYDAGKTNAGWNLVGNPFPVDAYINRNYYVMNASGSGLLLLPISASTPIPPCTGVFVKAEGEGETVIFTRVAP